MLSKTEVVARWYRILWTEGRVDQIGSLYAPADAADCLMPQGSIDPNEISDLISILHEFLDAINVDVLHCVQDGSWISAMLRLSGEKAGTGTPVTAVWQTSMRIEGEIIVESYPTFDFVPFFEQLGQLPHDAFALLLSGTILR